MGSRAARVGLFLLLAIYITNQWSRYSVVYLGGVAISECPGKAAGDPCFFEKGSEELPKCESYECASEQCKVCQKCYAEHDAAWRNLKYGTCLTSSQYGVLVSYGYMAVFCVTGLFAGRLADLYSRRNLVVGAAVVWSAFTVLQGASSSFGALLVSRLGMGLAHAFSGPASLSMIADLYAPEERAGANGVYTFGIYVGGGLSSLSLVAANLIGWRATSVFIAACGIVAAAVLAFAVAEPESDAFRGEQGSSRVEQADHAASMAESDVVGGRTSAASDALLQRGPDGAEAPAVRAKKPVLELGRVLSIISQDKVVLLLFVAAPLRFLGGFAIGTFLPQYFSRRFPDDNTAYSTLNALIVSLGGATSAYLGGRITDKWKRSNVRAPALVPALASLLATVPFLGVLYFDNFYAAIACLLFEYLVAESWFGPAISIMQERVPAAARGVTVSIYLFISGLVGSLAPALLGSLDDGASWEGLRRNLLIFVGISYLGTFVVFCFVALALSKPYTILQS